MPRCRMQLASAGEWSKERQAVDVMHRSAHSEGVRM